MLTLEAAVEDGALNVGVVLLIYVVTAAVVEHDMACIPRVSFFASFLVAAMVLEHGVVSQVLGLCAHLSLHCACGPEFLVLCPSVQCYMYMSLFVVCWLPVPSTRSKAVQHNGKNRLVGCP